MARRSLALMVTTLALAVLLPAAIGAQERAAPSHPPPADTLRGHVFIGGYFYDPFFGPYPWWPRGAYPRWYVPRHETRADLRIHVQPDDAERSAVYVDGFYAGIVDDFDGVFQGLPLTPGGHRIVLYLEGYRTVAHNIYLGPGSTFSLRQTMEQLPAGETSRPPELAPPVPPPPAGTYWSPVTPPRQLDPPAPLVSELEGVGTLDISVQPASAEVVIDGRRWMTSEDGHVVVDLPAGRHRVEVIEPGHQQVTLTFVLQEGKTLPIKLTLPPTAPEPFSGGPWQ